MHLEGIFRHIKDSMKEGEKEEDLFSFKALL
jgi:hypothetical protein